MFCQDVKHQLMTACLHKLITQIKAQFRNQMDGNTSLQSKEQDSVKLTHTVSGFSVKLYTG
jgi:hypothetical protein